MNTKWVRTGTLIVCTMIFASVAYAQKDQRQLVSHLLMANMAEVELGKIAVQHASNPEVKRFGQMMIDDHSKANTELMPIAQELGVEMPKQLDQKQRALADRLSKLQGAEFDREYIRAMVEDHREDISEVRPVAQRSTGTGSEATGTSGTKGTAGKGAIDARVHQYAAKTMPVLEKHLKTAQQIEKTLGKGK